MLSVPLLAGIGAFAGFLAGIIGAGGGVATLLLLIGVGMDPHLAVGTSLLFSVGMGGGGSLIHYRQGTADHIVAMALAVPAAVTAVIGAHLNGALPDWTLTLGLAALASATSIAVLLQPSRPEPRGGHVEARPHRRFVIARCRRVPGGTMEYEIHLPLAASGGAAIGLAQGLLGVGGGFLFVPVMVRAMKIPEHVAVGSSLFAIMLGGLSGGITHSLRHNVDFGVLFALLPFGLVGVWAGARASRSLSGTAIRRTFAIALILTAVLVTLKAVT